MKGSPFTRGVDVRPEISVIIPTWNRAWIVGEAIDSVLAQTFRNFELIVVNDGSTDDTDALLKTYGDGILRIDQANRGVSAARNRGIAIAKGRLIAFLDSDDLWLPDKLMIQRDFFRQHPDALICQTEETWVRRGVRVNPKNRHRKRSGWIFEPSLELCLVSPSAVMADRRLFDAVGLFDEDLPACEDYDLWLRVGCRFPIYLLDRPLIVKRGGHEDQLSRNWGLDRYRIRAMEKILESGELDANQRAATFRMLHEKCLIYGEGCRKRGNLEEALACEKIARRFI